MKLLKIKEFRKAAGLTQKDLGDMVGASPVSISFYENGIQSPDVNMLKKLADALCTSVDALVEHNQILGDEEWEFRENIRNNPNYRLLFSAAKTAKPEHLRAAVAVLQSLKGEENAN